jgi:nucleoside-diphosphate-sugar epimerase
MKLDWRPEIELRQGVQHTADWFRKRLAASPGRTHR